MWRWVLGLAVVAQSVRAQSDLPPDTDVNEIRGYHKREHSLTKPYQGSGLDIPYWDITGSTMVTANSIQLTADTQSRQGAIWNRQPIRSRDWEAVLSFKIHGSTGDLFGDGIAFWYAKEAGMLGPVFGSKDNFHGLAVFLDTYSNHNGVHSHGHPYISAMVSNGTQRYDHDRDGTHTQLGGEDKGCEAKFRNKNHETQVLVRYAGDTVQVYTDIDNAHKWKLCFSVGGVRLPAGYYLGVSAATGELSDAHEVIGLKLYELDVARAEKLGEEDRYGIEPEAKFQSAPRDHVDDPKPSKLGGHSLFLPGEEDRYGIEPEAKFQSAPRDHVDDPKPSKLGGHSLFLPGEEDRYGIEPEAKFQSAPRDHVDDPKPSKLGGHSLFLPGEEDRYGIEPEAKFQSAPRDHVDDPKPSKLGGHSLFLPGEEDRYGIEPEAKFQSAPRDHVDDPKPSKLGGFGTFFLYLLGLVAVVGFVWVGIVMLQKRQEHNRKRFY